MARSPNLLTAFADLTRRLTGSTPDVQTGASMVETSPRKEAAPAPLTSLLPAAPTSHDLSVSQKQALKAAQDPSIRFLFVTGKAGTGKSTLIREFQKMPRTIVVAPTGIAALNAGGATVHSVFQIPPHFLDPQAPRTVRASLLGEVQTLVIDEFPMVRCDQLDHIDQVLRYNRDDPRPFGGVKVIGVGDCYQLPPVVTEDDEPLLKMRYPSPYWFDANVSRSIGITMLELMDVFRQKDDGFVKFLNAARLARIPDHWLDRFNQLCYHQSKRHPDDLVLTSVRAAADDINRRRLEAIAEPEFTYRAELTGAFERESERNLPVPMVISLRKGARVVVSKNNHAVPNGTQGTVVDLDEKSVTVQPDGHKETIVFEAMQWEKIAYTLSDSRKIEVKVVGTLKQIPLLLGWAITIHKSQGLTLPRACIDLGSRAFAPGQAYVALSRVASMAGLSLRRPLSPTDFFVEPRVTQRLAELADHSLMGGP